MISLRMSSFTYGSIALKPVVPASLSAFVIPGSEVASAEGNYGKILFQAIHAGDITFMYNIFQVEEDIAIDFQCDPEAIQVHASIRNDTHLFIRGIGDLYLAEGQFNILDAPHLEGTYYLEGGREYRTLHIDFCSSLLDKLLPAFPYLEEWLASDTERPRLLFKVNPWLSTQLKDISERILHATYTNELQHVYRELKAREFVFLALTPGSPQEITPAVRLTRRNAALIHESKHILDQSFDQHITVASVAQKVGMNEFKLKAGFKQVFGISMFDYLINTRMQVARNLLLETDKPIKEIASLTGYATKQSFLSAFKRYFHDTPGSFRKN
jgi:AraC-like DNA-binding protein